MHPGAQEAAKKGIMSLGCDGDMHGWLKLYDISRNMHVMILMRSPPSGTGKEVQVLPTQVSPSHLTTHLQANRNVAGCRQHTDAVATCPDQYV
jgi:hypothetical protein